MDNNGGAMNIKEIRQERAELLGEQADRKQTARAVLTAPDKDEDERDQLLAGLEDRIGTIDQRLAFLAKRESQWELYKQDSIAEPAIREGSDLPTGEQKAPTPFGSLGEQLQAVAASTRDPYSRHSGIGKLQEIQAAIGAGEDVPSDGGHLVQTDFTSELIQLVHETGKLSQRTDRKPIGPTSNGLKINAVDETSRADGSRTGGLRAYWIGEAAALTGTKPTYRMMELSLQKLTGLYYSTDELLADTVALSAFVQAAFAKEFGFKVDDGIVRGSGAGQPLGILGHAGTIDIAKETGQAATTVVSENILKMYARMWAPSVSKAEWYINQDVWEQLFKLVIVTGTGGVPMFIMPGGMPNAPNGSLMGRPVTPIEHCETLGTSGDIIFADFSEYLMIEKGGIDAASSIHVQFLTDETVFRFILRTDGQPKRNAALTPYKGTNTQSSFVTLATRA